MPASGKWIRSSIIRSTIKRNSIQIASRASPHAQRYSEYNENHVFKIVLFLILQRIEQVKSANEGILYGLTDNKATIVLGFGLTTASIENNLPIGFKALGTIHWGENLSDVIDSSEVRCMFVAFASIQSIFINFFLSIGFVHHSCELRIEKRSTVVSDGQK